MKLIGSASSAGATRGPVFLSLMLAAFIGAVLVFGLVIRYLWDESVRTEEARVEELARRLGQHAEALIVDARDMLDRFNQSTTERCSQGHISAMNSAAATRPHIRAIGYWRAAERVCGVGFIQGVELRPSRADRIYDSGVIAWWPGPQTEIGGVQLFLMRYGDHDVAIDPGMLLQAPPDASRQAGLWVEDLPMATTGNATQIPSPGSLPVGLTLDNDNYRVLSRFTLGAIFPMDIVAVETIDRFWERYLPALVAAAGLGLALAAGWIYAVLRYSRHRMSLTTELRSALNSGRINAHYQPIIELATGRCIGAEALARWIRDDGEVVRSDVFIPLAEESGMVHEVTMAIVAATLADLAELLRAHPRLCININVTPDDLRSDSFGRRLRAALANASVPAQCIKLEITERAMVNTDQSRATIRELRQNGHQIAVDDFGTGYSSLAYLQTFEMDTLKIDKSFVDSIGTEATNHVIGHVIEMAASLKLDTVAEGIESIEQTDWLIQQGVEYGQGFLYSKPLPAKPFRAFYLAHGGREEASEEDPENG